MAWGQETNIRGPAGPQGLPGADGAPGAGAPGTAPPLMDGAAAVGTSMLFSREDHRHPSDTSRAAVTYVDSQDALKADKTYVDAADALKADKTYVDAADALKADKTYVDAADALKASTSYVDAQDAKAVRYDAAQALTAAQQEQGRKNVYAAPLDALAYSGMQINGSVDISQERSFNAPLTTSGYVCDGWQTARIGTNVVSVTPWIGALFPNLPNYLYLQCTTAQAAMLAGDYVILYQKIEGYRIARLGWGTANAQPITIGFWSSHNRPGVYGGSVRNSVPDRSYAFIYNQVSAAPQYNTITIPGDTAGSWLSTNGVGLWLTFAMAAGTTFVAPAANVWGAGSYMTAPGQINGVAATSDFFRISGVVVLPGNEAPVAGRASLIMRPYDQELLTCMRYLEGSGFTGPLAPGFFYSTSIFIGAYAFKVAKRATPTLIVRGTGADYGIYRAGAANAIDMLPVLDGAPSPIATDLKFTHSIAPFTAGQGGIAINMGINGQLLFDARL